MTPAIECGGKDCSFKVKTAAEPATDQQMQGLVNAAADHATDQMVKLSDYLLKVAVPGIGNADEGSVGRHRPIFIYHSRTPEKGFEKATVVE